MTPNEYRQKHKRCVTCEYFIEFAKRCKVKEIYIGKEQDMKKAQRFCKVYKAKEFKENA